MKRGGGKWRRGEEREEKRREERTENALLSANVSTRESFTAKTARRDGYGGFQREGRGEVKKLTDAVHYGWEQGHTGE